MQKWYIGHNKGKIANINKSRKMGGGQGKNSDTLTVIKLSSLTVIKLFQFIYVIHTMWFDSSDFDFDCLYIYINSSVKSKTNSKITGLRAFDLL